MHEVRLEIDSQDTMDAHREAMRRTENQLDEYLDDFKRRDAEYGPRPAPTGKFAPRRIPAATHAYIEYHQQVIRANNDLFTRVINSIQEKLLKVDVDAVTRQMDGLRSSLGQYKDDMADAISQLANEVGAAQKQALEAIDLLKDAHARMDDLEEELL